MTGSSTTFVAEFFTKAKLRHGWRLLRSGSLLNTKEKTINATKLLAALKNALSQIMPLTYRRTKRFGISKEDECRLYRLSVTEVTSELGRDSFATSVSLGT